MDERLLEGDDPYTKLGGDSSLGGANRDALDGLRPSSRCNLSEGRALNEISAAEKGTVSRVTLTQWHVLPSIVVAECCCS